MKEKLNWCLEKKTLKKLKKIMSGLGRPKVKKSTDCLDLKSRNDLFEDSFYRADNYFLERKSYRATKEWLIQVDNVAWFNSFDKLPVTNLAKAYHGVFVQWWEHYYPGDEEIDVLLMGESKFVASELSICYPHWNITTTDLYTDLRADQSGCDIICDMCNLDALSSFDEKKFDLIVSQAIIEHVYAPFTYMLNASALLKKGGRFFVHTVTPGFPYHAFPRDYFRFFSDWFIDIPDHIKSNNKIELKIVELLNIRKNLTKNSIFVCYERG